MTRPLLRVWLVLFFCLLIPSAALAASIFTNQTPALLNNTDGPGVNYELGTKFRSTSPGQITAIRFWKASNETGTAVHTGRIWSSTGTLLASVAFSGETASGWQVQNLATPLTIAANTTYTVSVNTRNTYYVATDTGLSSSIVNSPLSTVVGNNGTYGSPGAYPTSTYQASNYFRDIVFTPSAVQQYTIAVSASPVGGGTVSGGGTFDSGTSNTVTATPSSGYAFTNWTVNGAVVSTSASYTFTLNTNTTLVANFAPASPPVISIAAPVAITATAADPTGIASITITATLGEAANVLQTCRGTTTCSVTWTPPTSDSYIITATAVNNAGLMASATVTVMEVASTTPPVQYTVMVSAAPSADGTVSGGGTFPAGTSETVTATANSGFIFVNWTDTSGNVVSSSASYTFTLSGNTSLVANFMVAGGTGMILPADRDAGANWRMAGMASVGGIPNRTTVCATVSPSGGNDTSAIQAAINSCPLGNVVQLSAGTFTISEGSTIQMGRGITLRGMGKTSTILNRPNGATVGSYFPGNSPSAVINIAGSNASGSTVPLTANAAQGSSSIQVSNASGYSVGEIVLLDEASGSGWQPDHVISNEQVWASPDYRVVWNIHNPSMNGDDCCLGNNSSIFGYFQVHPDHPTNEMHQISGISGNTITFDSPVTISYRTSHGAQLTPMIGGPTNAGVEELAVKGGDDSNIHFSNAAYAWVKNVDDGFYLNDGVRIEGSFRLQLDGLYVHDAAWPVNGGAGYNISIAFGASELLIQNSISVRANKVMVARAAGTGSVIAYNYMDDGFISGSDGWVEIGLNASHLVGGHHVLFEGNWGFNADSDQTHGNAVYMTFFRNWLTGFRSRFTDYLNNQVVNDAAGCCGPQRAAAAHSYAYWHSFIGNVLGTPGLMNGWVENGVGGSNQFPPNAIWMLGWVDISPQGHDPQVEATAIRDGNYDYVTNSQKWFNTPAMFTIPSSLYLTSVPAFFGSNQWPWVDPSTGATHTLPAKARFDAGTP